MSYQAPSLRRIASFRIVAIYALFGFAWIYGSDTLLGWLVHDPAIMVKIAVIKGSLFIFITAVLLYFLINRFAKQIITERKQAETEIKKSEEKFATAFKASPEALAITSMEDGRYIEINDAFLELTGLKRNEVIGRTSIDLNVWLDLEQRRQYLEKLSIDRSLKNFETKFRVKNNEVRDFLVSSGLIEIEGKECTLNFITDITERKQTEMELLRNTEELKESQQISHVGSWRLDLASNEVIWSEELYRMYGFDPKLPPPPYTEHQKLFTAESWELLSSSLKNTRDTGIPYDLELQTVREDGSFGWMWAYGMTVLDADGVTVGLRGMAQDITEVKAKEIALRDSETKYRMLLNNLSAGVVVHAYDSSIIFSNPMASTLLGLSNDQMLGKTAIDPDWHFVQEDGTPMSLEEYPVNQVLKFGKPLSNFALGICRPDLSDPLWVVCNAYPIENPEDHLTQIVVVFSDITKLKKADEDKLLFEQQFQQTQKLESLGILAGGIAHDFNNILAIIMGYCSLTKIDYETAKTNIPEIEKAAERAAALCRQMLSYAGKTSLTSTHFSLTALADEMVAMLRTTINQNVVIKHKLDSDIPTYSGDESQIRQIVMNLIINAAEAIGDAAGEVQVLLSKTEIKAEPSEKGHFGDTIKPGLYACLEVSDNGCGMDEITQKRLFEPFYTTKFTGRGLGMSAVLGIIKAHNGALRLESQPGQGTTFKVYLPVQRSKSEAKEAQQIKSSVQWQGSGTILLVEDEIQVKSIAIALINKLGFNVIDAADGKEALELYQKHSADITLVVTDMGMPIMNGYELFYKLKRLNPKLPIIISSGFGEGDITFKIPAEDIAGLINKPYSFNQLQDVLKGVVELIQKQT